MNKFWMFLKMVVLVSILAAQSVGTASAQSAPQSAFHPALLSPAGLLNPDGTLRLDAHTVGSLNLAGWDVRVDPRLGPVFSPHKQDLLPIVMKFFGWAPLGDNGAGNGSLNQMVWAVGVRGPQVYVGGNFTDVNNKGTVIPQADYIAEWDGSNWSALGGNGAGNGSLNGAVWSISVSDFVTYIGGNFTNVNNKGTVLGAADYVAIWDGSNWSALGSNGAGNGSLNGPVNALFTRGTGVFAGGSFTNVNNHGTVIPQADYVAEWDGTNWSAMGGNGAGNGSLNGLVDAIAISGSNIYVGGEFTNVNNNGSILTAADYIARWDGSNWSALGNNGAGNGSLNSFAEAIAVNGSDVYVGGDFTNVNNQGTVLGAADYIAKWDGSNWSALGSNGAGNGALNAAVFSLAVNGNQLFVGGTFTVVNNKGTVLGAGYKIARWNGSNWFAVGHGASLSAGSINGQVNALAPLGESVYGVYAAGGFTDVNDSGTVLTAADSVAKYSYGTIPFESTGADDGWVLESMQSSSVGGSLNATAGAIVLGDDAANRQYRSILHFDTSALPDTAKIVSVMLKIKRYMIVGSNPFGTLQNIRVDLIKGAFGGNPALQATDFQAAASLGGVGTLTNAPWAGNWYVATISPSTNSYINLTGPTELRLEFQLGDNGNGIADDIKFYSGDYATAGYRPVLSITYSVP